MIGPKVQTDISAPGQLRAHTFDPARSCSPLSKSDFSKTKCFQPSTAGERQLSGKRTTRQRPSSPLSPTSKTRQPGSPPSCPGVKVPFNPAQVAHRQNSICDILIGCEELRCPEVLLYLWIRGTWVNGGIVSRSEGCACVLLGMRLMMTLWQSSEPAVLPAVLFWTHIVTATRQRPIGRKTLTGDAHGCSLHPGAAYWAGSVYCDTWQRLRNTLRTFY